MDDIVDVDIFSESRFKNITAQLNNLINVKNRGLLFDRIVLNHDGPVFAASSSEVELSVGGAYYCKAITVVFSTVNEATERALGVDLVVIDAHGCSTTIRSAGGRYIDGLKFSDFSVGKLITGIHVKNTKSISISINEITLLGQEIGRIEKGILDYEKSMAAVSDELKDFLLSVEQFRAECVERAKKEHKALAEVTGRLDAVRKNKGEVDKKIEEQRKKFEDEKTELFDLEVSKSDKNKELEQLEESISNLNLKLANLSGSEAEIQSRIEDERRKQEALKQDVGVIEANIARLRSQEQLYSEDFSSIRSMFNSHGRLYFLLIILASSGALWVMTRIYEAAMNIATTTDVANPVSIVGVLVSRLPIALVNVLVVGALVKLIWVLVVKLLDNNNSLAEINQMAYLVRESVEEHKEDFKDESSENKQRMRTQMKTSLIRNFMCGESQRKSDGSNDMAKTCGGIELSKFTDVLKEFIKLVKPDAKNE